MVIVARIKRYLEEQGVDYKATVHPTAYTAQQVAQATHTKGKTVAKVVMLKADGKLVMAVLPATHRVSLEKAKAVLAAQDVSLAKEEEFKDLFPDCEVGAEPPFGNLYGVEMIADSVLWEDAQITFNAGTHSDAITIAFTDWLKLTNPKRAEFAEFNPR